MVAPIMERIKSLRSSKTPKQPTSADLIYKILETFDLYLNDVVDKQHIQVALEKSPRLTLERFNDQIDTLPEEQLQYLAVVVSSAKAKNILFIIDSVANFGVCNLTSAVKQAMNFCYSGMIKGKEPDKANLGKKQMGRLVRRIKRLPVELQLMILKEYYDWAMIPGKILIPSGVSVQRSKKSKMCKTFAYSRHTYDSPCFEALFAMDRATSLKYKALFLTENRFVVPQGDVHDFLSFRSRNQTLFNSAPKIEVRFKPQDASVGLNILVRSGQNPFQVQCTAVFRELGTKFDLTTFLEGYEEACSRYSEFLADNWFMKLTRAYEMPSMESIFVDFGDAYGPDGRFLGFDVMEMVAERSSTEILWAEKQR